MLMFLLELRMMDKIAFENMAIKVSWNFPFELKCQSSDQIIATSHDLTPKGS